MSVKAAELKQTLANLANEKDREQALRFFKTGQGSYSEGDEFLGIRMPILRKLAKQHRDLPLTETQKLLRSRYHEERMFALQLLVEKFNRADVELQDKIYTFYQKNTRYINNWDLVDASAYKIIGEYLLERDRDWLYELAKSKNLWERRISIISTYQFIRNDQYSDTLKIAKILLHDTEDLMHKAVGWMLREVGNRDRAIEIKFLDKHYKTMPRTMLRYAIEKFPAAERKAYLAGTK